jgi:hypothetical protein
MKMMDTTCYDTNKDETSNHSTTNRISISIPGKMDGDGWMDGWIKSRPVPFSVD